MNLTFLDSIYKWGPVVFVFLCLASFISFSVMSSRFIYCCDLNVFVFHNGSTNLHLHQQSTEVLFSRQHFIFCYFDNSLSDRCGVISRCGLICISLMISDVEHFFIYLLTIWVSLEKYLLRFLPFLKSGYLYSCLSCLSSLYILDINPLSDVWLADIFPIP